MVKLNVMHGIFERVPVNIHRPGTGDVVEAVRHIRTLHKEIRMVQMMESDELFTYVTWASLCLGIAWLEVVSKISQKKKT